MWHSCENVVMKAYERRTRRVIELFLTQSISFTECIAALDSEFGRIITKVTGQELLAVTALTLANNETVMNEMARRTA